jgi:hypothetical protein
MQRCKLIWAPPDVATLLLICSQTTTSTERKDGEFLEAESVLQFFCNEEELNIIHFLC